MSEPLVRLDKICFRHADGKEVLDGVSLELMPGEHMALHGANGCGKTTLLHIIMGLLRPQSGTVFVLGGERSTEADFQEIRGPVGLLFQDADDQLFCPTVAEDISFGPLNLGRSPAETEAIVGRVLQQTGLEGYADRLCYRLSVGEKRRVALATVLAMEPRVLLLDEPTAGLDGDSRDRVIEILQAIDAAMIVVSHDEEFLQQLTDRAWYLAGGRIHA